MRISIGLDLQNRREPYNNITTCNRSVEYRLIKIRTFRTFRISQRKTIGRFKLISEIISSLLDLEGGAEIIRIVLRGYLDGARPDSLAGIGLGFE